MALSKAWRGSKNTCKKLTRPGGPWGSVFQITGRGIARSMVTATRAELSLTDDEIDAVARYLAAIGNRPDAATALPDPATFPAAVLDAGKTRFVITCAQCHSLGSVVQTPLAAQQGPDLIRATGRVD